MLHLKRVLALVLFGHEPGHAPLILINLGAFWVNQGLLDMLGTIVSKSHFGKRPTACEMSTFGFHVGAQSVNSY